ncbi:pilus assembly protein TadG-related protein [Pseudarthrobacter sp. L19]|uniref:pilus assembly protein TadG-related protein n=1 Tax=Pseudarthrobacter sp. L19 TaxID=3423951 RepID=UPI003D7B1FF6
MRRLACPASDRDGEHGAIAVIVAVLMVALLGFAAIAVDVGMLYAERTQLSNGADAGAFAIAQKCAKNVNDPNCSATSSLPGILANGNTGDGLSNIQSVALDTTNRTVTVTAGAQEAGKAPNKVSLFFARVLGIKDASVTAAATVQWGSPVAGPTAFPIAFSVCQVNDHIGAGAQLLVSHGSKAETSCKYVPSGQVVPGGFGWLKRPDGGCAGNVSASGWADGDPGNSYPNICNNQLISWASDIQAGKDVIVLLPIFDQVTGTGTSVSYHLTSFAAFKVQGWSFNGNKFPITFRNAPPDVSPALSCTGSCVGVIGSFIRYVSLDNAYTLGTPPDFGAGVIKLTQ